MKKFIYVKYRNIMLVLAFATILFGQKGRVEGWHLDYIHVLYLEIFLKHVSQLWPWQTRWKLKVKQLEREVDRHKHGANQLMQRNEQLVKEVEGHRQNLHHTGIQMENMKRELGDALVSIF